MEYASELIAVQYVKLFPLNSHPDDFPETPNLSEAIKTHGKDGNNEDGAYAAELRLMPFIAAYAPKAGATFQE